MDGDHVIVLPGGGYEMLADHEGEPVAEWLRSLGLTASVFRYPVNTRHPVPRDEILGEVRARRAGGARRVAVIGFSAGAHAAGLATLSAHATDQAIDLAVLCYPVVSMLFDHHEGSRRNLIGLDASPALRAETSLETLVTADSPPFFIWHTADDEAVPVEHSYALAEALAGHGVDHELHVFRHGRHGLGLAPGEPAGRWTSLCESWLRDQRWID
ncbi:MAG TPA: alpha/beta hydrolase [Lacisediminihabitans sp.]|uniref:alpha/beta hydrolase n=1 Tax=Lacisediminihabitans sp. TaxID=2787631 RepID=UPI002EDA006D